MLLARVWNYISNKVAIKYSLIKLIAWTLADIPYNYVGIDITVVTPKSSAEIDKLQQ